MRLSPQQDASDIGARDTNPDVLAGQRLHASLIQNFNHLEALLPEWTELYARSTTPNPFAHPQWTLTWARHFVLRNDLYVVVVHDNDGRLVGLAPFHRVEQRLGPGIVTTQLRLVGSPRIAHLTELPQILTTAHSCRKVLREIVDFLYSRAEDWDWVEFMLSGEQGWFEPNWVPPEAVLGGAFALHRRTRSFVMMPLAPTIDEFHAQLKRNVKNSIRRGINRLQRQELRWECAVPGNEVSLDSAVDELLRLHRMRALTRGRVTHADYMEDAAARAFLRDVAHAMHPDGFIPYLLQVNGVAVAARLLLRANSTAFFSLSGFDPAWWDYNVATVLMRECLADVIGRGDVYANLSLGPEISKLRWSEQVGFHHEFVMANSRPRSQLAVNLHLLVGMIVDLHRERQRFRERYIGSQSARVNSRDSMDRGVSILFPSLVNAAVKAVACQLSKLRELLPRRGSS